MSPFSLVRLKMVKQQKRNKAYYEERLIHEHPSIYADLLNGKYWTVTEAAIAAGLKTPRTRLHELKNAWQKLARRNEMNSKSGCWLNPE